MIDSRPITESGESLVTLIRAERQRELCLEGHRRFDLRRYTVCEKCPSSKTITHYYASITRDGPEYTNYGISKIAWDQTIDRYAQIQMLLPHPKVKHITRDVKTA